MAGKFEGWAAFVANRKREIADAKKANEKAAFRLLERWLGEIAESRYRFHDGMVEVDGLWFRVCADDATASHTLEVAPTCRGDAGDWYKVGGARDIYDVMLRKD